MCWYYNKRKSYKINTSTSSVLHQALKKKGKQNVEKF